MSNKLASITKKQDGFEIRLERVLPFSPEVVWDAITDPQKLAIWFTDIEMDFTVGGKMTIWFRDEQKTESFGKITRIEAPRIFEYTWEDELATWEIFPEGAGRCKLMLTYSRLPDQYAHSVPAGWHQLLDQLETVLNGRTEPYPFGGEETPEGKQLKAVYAEIVRRDFLELKIEFNEGVTNA
jgi:uncharacterized protein YndB with AHSA1/START domain